MRHLDFLSKVQAPKNKKPDLISQAHHNMTAIHHIVKILGGLAIMVVFRR